MSKNPDRGRRRLFNGPAVLFYAGLAACGGDGGAPATQAVQDSAGVEVVSNSISAGWSTEGAPRFVEELRIGTVDGDPPYQFGQLAGRDVDENGHIYVADMQAHEVKAFDGEGTLVRTIGRSGEGPGEFRTPAWVAVLKDEIRVVDVSNLRVQRLGRDGRVQGTEPMVGGISLPYRLPAEAEFLEYRRPSPVVSAGGITTPDEFLVRRRLASDLVDTVLAFPARETSRFEGGRMRMKFNAPEPMWALARGHVLFAMSTEFRIEERSLDGDLVRIITLDLAPIPMSPSRKEELLGRFPASMRENMDVVPNHPVIHAMMEGPEGTTWVQSPVISESESEPSNKWLIFDAGGRFLGALES